MNLHINLLECPRLFNFAVNTSGCDKDWDWQRLATEYVDRSGTIHDVMKHVKKGHALCAGLLGGKRRKKANVHGTYWLLLDIDNSDVWRDGSGNILDEDGVLTSVSGKKAKKIYKHQLTIEEALTHSFIKEHCALIYTTASHKPEWHKFRLVFLLPEYVAGYQTVEILARYLMKHLPHDPACKDAGRVFYGSTRAEFPLVNPNATLPQEWVSEAIALGEKEHIQREKEAAERKARVEKFKQAVRESGDDVNWDFDELIEQALEFIPPRQPGSGNYEECLHVLMALNSHYGSIEAAEIADSWSPSIPGTTWDVDRKIRSFGNSGGITIGTLFHIAKKYGFEFPKLSSGRKELTREEWLQLESVQERHAIEAVGKKLLGFARNLFKPRKRKKQRKLEPPVKMRGNVIYYKPGHQLEAYLEALERFPVVLDATHTGGGKSHFWGTVNPEDFNAEKINYTTPHHRNPSTVTIRDRYADLPVRNPGLFRDDSEIINGESRVRWAKDGEEPNLPGNCIRTELFHILAEKGYSEEVSETSGKNIICQTCPMLHNCRGYYGHPGNPAPEREGVGYIRQCKKVHESNKLIRSSFESLSIEEYGEEGLKADEGKYWGVSNSGDFQVLRRKRITVIDELTQIPGIKTQTITIAELDATVALLHERGQLDKFGWLASLRTLLQEKNFHGFDHQAIIEKLGITSEDLQGIWDVAEAIHEDVADKLLELTENDEIDLANSDLNYQERKKLRKAIKNANKSLASDSRRKLREYAKQITPSWLKDFVFSLRLTQSKDANDVFSEIHGVTYGHPQLRIANHQLIIYKRDRHLQKALFGGNTPDSSYGVNYSLINPVFILDATATPLEISLRLGIPTEFIGVIKQEQPELANLDLIHITGLGHLGTNRSEDQKQRIDAIVNKLVTQNSDIAFIDKKANKQDRWGHWFHDSRGSNKYQEKKEVCFISDPYSDVGDTQAQYLTLGGDPEKLQEYIDIRVGDEIIQAIGRIRAFRRPGEKLTVYFIGRSNLDFLHRELPGIKIKEVDAFDFCPEAGDRNQRSKFNIFEGFKKAISSGVKPTIDNIADLVGRSKALLSKIAKDFGGWKKFVKSSLVLLEALNRGSELFGNDSELSEEELFIAKEFIPLTSEHHGDDGVDIVSEVAQLAKDDFEQFKRITPHIPKQCIAHIVAELTKISFDIFDFEDDEWVTVSNLAYFDDKGAAA